MEYLIQTFFSSLSHEIIMKKSLTEDELYEPKQSKRVRLEQTAKADGDTWVEHVVIYDKKTRKKRSYFKSTNTNKCVWDEPPSGASNIILFSERKI